MAHSLPKYLSYSMIKNKNLNVNTEDIFFFYFPEEKKVFKNQMGQFIFHEVHSVFIGLDSLPNTLFFVFDGVC